MLQGDSHDSCLVLQIVMQNICFIANEITGYCKGGISKGIAKFTQDEEHAVFFALNKLQVFPTSTRDQVNINSRLMILIN